MTHDPRICVGVISGAFGIRGEVRLKSFTANAEDIAGYGPLSSEDSGQTFTVALIGQVKGGFSARITGVMTKEQADALRGTRLYTSRENLPSLPDDEFYHADLMDLQVFDTGGKPLGHVKTVLNHGAGDILEITLPGSSATVLLPFTHEAVPTVDLTSGRLITDPPEGIFPDE
ncbi:16S rRNA processing protein RimM [hydrothermal vent metagenome]|uniref:16S rRNA processing protein RimM n=1 Tax=hydrothermal vent metagenome TaxID=652676 RepID=A0A3B0SGF2_9ZZZZ